jgi:hypothetical protein
MATFFSITLAVSIVGLVLLLVLKRYEMTTGRVVMGGLRPWVGSFFHHALHFVERGMPALMRSFIGKVLGVVRTQARHGFARVILLFEYNLERVLHVVRQKSRKRSLGEGVASEFLQEVAAHKQKLLRRAPKNRVIFED